MSYAEFEIALNQWLDEGREAELEQLLSQVRAEDRPSCEQLLLAYRTMLQGFDSTREHSVVDGAKDSCTEYRGIVAGSGQRVRVSPWAYALAACLAIVFLAQGSVSRDSRPAAQSTAVNVTAPRVPEKAQVAATTSPSASPIPRKARLSLEPLASQLVERTDSALRSLNEFSAVLNPIPTHLAEYRYQQAEPFLDTVTYQLLPGTQSISNALQVLQEAATAPSQDDTSASGNSDSPNVAVG